MREHLQQQGIELELRQRPAPCEEEGLLEGVPAMLASFYRQWGRGVDLCWFARAHPVLGQSVHGSFVVPSPRSLLVDEKRRRDGQELRDLSHPDDLAHLEFMTEHLRHMYWMEAQGDGTHLCLDLGQAEVPVALYTMQQRTFFPIAPSFEEFFLRCAERSFCFPRSGFYSFPFGNGGTEAAWEDSRTYPPELRIERAQLV